MLLYYHTNNLYNIPFMKNFKYMPAMLLAIPFLVLFTTKAFAKADVSITDNSDTHIATVSLTHGDETLNAVDMEIILSDNVSIQNLDTGNLDCSMNNSVTENGNKVEIFCLSENDLAKTGTLAEITYEVTDNSEYYFYVNQNTLDLGDTTVGKITDVNKPASVKDSVKQTTDDDNGTIFTTVWSFVKEYYMYLIAGAFVLTLIIVLLTSLKKDDVPTDTTTPTIV